MSYVSPCNHPESYLSGSTIESMIDKSCKLGLKYFSYTDQGYMSGLLKAYSYANKKEIKLIPGIELFFKDDDCEIIKNTESERIKYFKVIIHAKDQKSLQSLVKITSSTKRKKIYIGSERYPIYNWQDLEDICKNNVTICTSDIECMTTKHLLVGRADLAAKYYEKLRNMVGAENFYPTIIPFEQNKYWNKIVKIDLNGASVEIPSEDRVETDSKYRKNIAQDLTRRNGGHKNLTHVYINNIQYKVKDEFKEIKKISTFNDFSEFPNGDVQLFANRFIKAMASKYGDTLLINNYSFYADKEDKTVQDMKLGEDRRVYQSQYVAGLEDTEDYLVRLLGLNNGQVEQLVSNSYRFAANFDNFKLEYNYRLPDPGPEPEKQLIEIVKKKGRMKWDDPRYTKQFKEEFELLTKNGVIDLIPYFLPIVDISDFYNKNGYIVGPARGSAGGFLISYLLGITHVDPIKYDLSTSRFLTMDRVQQGNLPDIDFDTPTRVPLVGPDGNSGYLFERYGDKAAQCSTRTLLRIKSAILDANRFVNGKVEEDIQKLSKSLPNTPQGVNDNDYIFGYEDNEGNYIEGLLAKNEDLQKYAVDRPKEWNIVKRALSLSRQKSRHACSYFISDAPIEDTVPIMEIGGVRRVTQPEAKQCEEAGLIKYDFLVISCLKDIGLCLNLINEKNRDKDIETGYFRHTESNNCNTEYDKPIFIWDLPEDPKVFRMLSEGKTESVFQLNTTSVTPFVQKIQPQSIIDCATITSLVRPGPLDFTDEKTGRNMVEEYVERKFGRSRGSIEILNEMLPETYGIITYQEQVTKLAKELAGMNVEDSENVRIAVGKKKVKLIQSLKPIFIEGAAKKVGVETATTIWEMMETFASYGFNKSHAVAYSVVSYACAFLKYHYPLEWWASVLSNADNKEINEVFYKYVKDMVLPPDINVSTEMMTIDYNINKIRNKLSMISGLGSKVANNIMELRPYSSIDDFVNKKPCGPSLTKKLIHIGVLDSLFEKSDRLKQKMFKYEKAIKLKKINDKIGEYDLKIENAYEEKEILRIKKLKERYVEKNKDLSDIDIDPLYMTMTPKKDYLIKKSIFPTMNLDLQAVLDKESNTFITRVKNKRSITNQKGFDNILVNGETLQRIDNTDVQENAYFCCPAYVIDASEFSFAGGSKKALKLILDSSGYVSEKVLWPDYDTGELKYPKSLEKGCIAYFFYGKRVGKPYTNIYEIIIEEESIL